MPFEAAIGITKERAIFQLYFQAKKVAYRRCCSEYGYIEYLQLFTVTFC
jgi:hypothetical protein